MGVPVIAAAALNSRTGRRILTGAIGVLLLLLAFALTPLIAIPFAAAGQSASAAGSAYETGAQTPTVNGEWGYPLAGEYIEGRGFGYNPIHGCSFCSTNHKGFDMARECGATVYAAGPGRVVVARSYFGFGNAVRIDHGGGLSTIYGHLQWGSLRVHVGEKVIAGTPLGAEGNTGNSVGCHLHFEVRVNDRAIDAEPFMAARGLPLR